MGQDTDIGGGNMGLIANQMLIETGYQIKQKIQNKVAQKKNAKKADKAKGKKR